MGQLVIQNKLLRKRADGVIAWYAVVEPSLKGQTDVRFAITNLRTVVSAKTRRVVEEEGPTLVSRGPGERQAVQGQQNAVLAVENGGVVVPRHFVGKDNAVAASRCRLRLVVALHPEQ